MRRRFHFAMAGSTPPSGGVSLPASINVDDVAESPDTATASILFDSDGTYNKSDDPSAFPAWFTPDGPGVGDDYEIRFAPSSGSVSTGTVNAWLAFPQTWTRSRAVAGISDVSGTLEIRLIATGVVQASTTLTLTAERI